MFSFTCVNKGKQNACYSIHVHFFIFTSSSCNDTLKGYPYRSLSGSVVAPSLTNRVNLVFLVFPMAKHEATNVSSFMGKITPKNSANQN